MKKKDIPLRKYLFYGLTLVLASVFVFLAVRGRRIEKEMMQQEDETVENYPSTPIRILAPQDLEIRSESVSVQPGEAEESLPSALHRIEIYNSGNVSYSAIQIRLEYVDTGGEVLASRFHTVEGSFAPDSIFLIDDLSMNDIPVDTSDCRLSIVSADFEPVEKEPQI